MKKLLRISLITIFILFCGLICHNYDNIKKDEIKRTYSFSEMSSKPQENIQYITYEDSSSAIDDYKCNRQKYQENFLILNLDSLNPSDNGFSFVHSYTKSNNNYYKGNYQYFASIDISLPNEENARNSEVNLIITMESYGFSFVSSNLSDDEYQLNKSYEKKASTQIFNSRYSVNELTKNKDLFIRINGNHQFGNNYYEVALYNDSQKIADVEIISNGKVNLSKAFVVSFILNNCIILK